MQVDNLGTLTVSLFMIGRLVEITLSRDAATTVIRYDGGSILRADGSGRQRGLAPRSKNTNVPALVDDKECLAVWVNYRLDAAL